jgi:AraC-like DNA-binding protein
LGYPQAFVELAVLLALRHGRRRSARAMAVPLSTMYRWLDRHRRQPERLIRIERGEPEWLATRIADCEAHGFDLRARVGAVEPQVVRASAPNAALPLRAPVSALQFQAPATAAPAGIGAEAGAADVTHPLSAAARAGVRLARDVIDRHYYSPLSCERLAGLAGMSRFHFIRSFKAAYAIAPYHYLLQVRIRHARALLGTTAQPLDTIATAVGFDSPSSLSKAFRSVEGVSLSACFHGMRLGARAARPSVASPSVRAG